ncbi:MAG: hypothetical protein LKI24_04155 [Acidipropionibacterium sp.]|nr:hypothetical protein [Acidipropionibacterium sp.]
MWASTTTRSAPASRSRAAQSAAAAIGSVRSARPARWARSQTGRSGGGDADHADPDSAPGHHPFQDRDIAGERVAGGGVDDVGAQQRCRERLGVVEQAVEAVVELVVADHRGVVSHQVQGAGHRVAAESPAAGRGAGAGRQVAQRGALDGVAVVQQDDGLGASFGAGVFDEGGEPGQAQRRFGLAAGGPGVGGVWAVVEVVPVEQVAVHIGAGQDRQGGAYGVVHLDRVRCWDWTAHFDCCFWMCAHSSRSPTVRWNSSGARVSAAK